MGSKRNQTIAIARFLAYKLNINKRLSGMSEEDYLKNPVGFEVGRYIEDLMKYCPEETVDAVLEHQQEIIMRLGEDQLSVLAFMPYDGGDKNAGRPA